MEANQPCCSSQFVLKSLTENFVNGKVIERISFEALIKFNCVCLNHTDNHALEGNKLIGISECCLLGTTLLDCARFMIAEQFCLCLRCKM